MTPPMLHLTRSSYFADERLPLKLVRRTPQPPYPLHTHEFAELVVVFSGSGTHFTETGEQTVTSGDVFIIDGNNAHGFRNLNDLMLVNILFDPDRLSVPKTELEAIPAVRRQSRRIPRRRLRLDGRQLAKTESLIETLERECREKRTGYRSFAAATFLQIIGHLARCSAERISALPGTGHRLAEAVALLEENPDRRIRMDELVEISELSESTLLRRFKKAFGMSPLKYHLSLRIERACELLARPELSITEVSYRSGFSDSNYFSRQFRKVKQRSPREYRRQAVRLDVKGVSSQS